MVETLYKSAWHFAEGMLAPLVDRRKGDRRSAAAAGTPVPADRPLKERRQDRRKLAYAALWCLPSVFASAYAGEMVQFDATRAFTAPQVKLRADVSRPAGNGPFPAVVLMHGCGGWQPAVRYTMNAYADYLINKGFVVLSLDSFGPRGIGGGAVCESVPKQVDALDYRTYDARDALNYLKSQPYVDSANVFLMGQSNGGSVAINVAKGDGPHSERSQGSGYRAVVAFYPWCGSFGNSQVRLAKPLLVFGGGQDSWTPTQQCETAHSAGAELNVKVYPEAAHSFDLEIMPQNYLGNKVGLNREAADDSRERMLSFFMRHVSGKGWQATRVATANTAEPALVAQ